ncbi:MAG: nucleoid occlusion factor SlmA [Gammaproteobacteria bacterium]|nr:MAG: nucleoid occlusion factor SlmA [Gammaproteobacteria bacterium]
MPRGKRGERRQVILETLARMLAERSGERITTAELAKAVGVSEAALYRHFPSKAKMLEALIEFIEESLFTHINRILAEEPAMEPRLRSILFLILGFADKNPGMARLLTGDALTGEAERLRKRVAQIYERIETQLKQILREASLNAAQRAAIPETAGLLLAFTEGRIARFVRSNYRDTPVDSWEKQWGILKASIALLR